MIQLALIGYGKMGQQIAQLAESKGFAVRLILDNEQDWQLKAQQLKQCDVAIEFSQPSTVVNNLHRCLNMGIPIVCGTTGWYESLPEIESLCKQTSGSLIYASNFSIGVNIFMEINKKLSVLLSKYKEYQASIEEIHHIHKLDAPSGTAITLANDIIVCHKAYQTWVEEKKNDHELPIKSVREGAVPGTHIISWESVSDTIEIKHEAKNRQGFAVGALLAASWIMEKKGVFTMKDLLDL